MEIQCDKPLENIDELVHSLSPDKRKLFHDELLDVSMSRDWFAHYGLPYNNPDGVMPLIKSILYQELQDQGFI